MDAVVTPQQVAEEPGRTVKIELTEAPSEGSLLTFLVTVIVKSGAGAAMKPEGDTVTITKGAKHA